MAKILMSKGAFWNAGMFCFKAGKFLEELERYKPKLYGFYNLTYKSLFNKFAKVPPDSIDYAIMQKTKNAALVEFNLKWSDLGSWDGFLDFHTETKIGKAEFLDSRNCFVYSPSRRSENDCATFPIPSPKPSFVKSSDNSLNASTKLSTLPICSSPDPLPFASL